ncbi:hypothetical protein BA062_35780 [Prauserella flavalba]|uniref:HTH luxR-type domain-containing protein n=1 Tax=Prauserella flavalba TaxID=1477506 RepID=A0A318LMU8_9PSEU|nr:hypothetical protein BA062_35780 [Prauserella flavalba]
MCTWLSHAVASSDVTLVCAPAGFGKTLLLAEWIATRSDAVWVSLDHDDDSAEHFLAALLSAIGEHAPPAPAQTDSSVPPGDIVTAVTELADAIEALPGRLVLVLDNLQEVPGRAALRVLATIIRHQPRNLRLVLSARSDPPLPLARLRVQGRLTELRADGLRFGQVEARELLARSGVTLTDGQLKRLVAQTDGWAAGIRLAARSLRLTGDPERLLSEYVSHDHTVADFLTGEVLSHLAADNRALLAMLSVCEQVSPRLAASLTGRDDVGDVLAGLERDGVLVTAVDGEQLWYQLHPMLRAYLRAELTRHQPELVTTLHHRAAAWFADHDSPREALRHAEQTGDERAAANLLHGLGVDMLLDGWPGLVLRGLTAAGTTVARDPWLLLFSGLAHLELGDLTTAESDIARSAQAWPSHEDERLAAFRRLVVSAHALACGRRPVPGDDGTCFSTTMEAWERLDHGLALLADRDYPGAGRELEAADRLSDEQDLHYLAVHTKTAQALLAAVTGEHAVMAEYCELALALAGQGTWEQSPWLAVCHAMLGFVRLLQADPFGALECAAKLEGADSPVLRFAAAVVEGVARFDGGERVAGLRLLHENRADLAEAPVPRQLAAMAMVLEHQCALNLAQFPLAREVAEWGAHRLGPTAEGHLTVARTRFARGDLDGTERALVAAREPGVPQLVPGTKAELDLLEAAAALRLDCRTKARSALDRALALAAPGRTIRPFAHVEPDVRRLLLDQTGGFGDAESFAAEVRHTFAAAGADLAATVLTGRERAVLVRLAASPQPLDEVASTLRVSVNTVKTHVRAIYAKLGVNNRRAAIVAARELGFG